MSSNCITVSGESKPCEVLNEGNVSQLASTDPDSFMSGRLVVLSLPVCAGFFSIFRFVERSVGDWGAAVGLDGLPTNAVFCRDELKFF